LERFIYVTPIIFAMQEIIIHRIPKPHQFELDQDFGWICDSLGLCSGRDIDRVSKQVMLFIMKNQMSDKQITSELISRELLVSQGIVNHHVRNLLDTGLLYRDKRVIMLRGGSLKCAVEELRKDAMRILDDIEQIAAEIDEALGLDNR
jgi:predicted transcriptional regulator